jgi:hypothetical protein
MMWYVYKSPRRFGELALETLNYEPTDFIIRQKAMKYGPIVVISEEELENERRENILTGK